MEKVTVTKDGKEEVTEFKDESSGVMPEVKAWAEGLVAGKPNPRQSPEEALADLEIVSSAEWCDWLGMLTLCNSWKPC
jgi:hypothetical protein